MDAQAKRHAYLPSTSAGSTNQQHRLHGCKCIGLQAQRLAGYPILHKCTDTGKQRPAPSLLHIVVLAYLNKKVNNTCSHMQYK
jgi:hypothetical protein